MRYQFYKERIGKYTMKKLILYSIFCLVLTACSPLSYTNIKGQTGTGATGTQTPSQGGLPTAPALAATKPAAAASTTQSPQATPTTRAATKTKAPKSTSTAKVQPTQATAANAKVPNFDHIILIVLENEDYETVIGNSHMPFFNALAKQNVLLLNDFAVRHPSLPNYIALMSGNTHNITSDCTDCFVNAPNLADLIENSGRTWKAYEEDMPSPCYIGNSGDYAQKHNPLIYFDSIRLNPTRCQRSIVPIAQLDSDLTANQLPNFSFIMPNLCNSGHDCSLDVADKWVNAMVTKLQDSTALGQKSLIIITFDEGNSKSTASCCGMSAKAGGRIATVLISPLAKPGFTDGTPISHYGLLKTILLSWNLPDLGNTKNTDTQAITQPWN